jgi:hypothetical protein
MLILILTLTGVIVCLFRLVFRLFRKKGTPNGMGSGIVARDLHFTPFFIVATCKNILRNRLMRFCKPPKER